METYDTKTGEFHAMESTDDRVNMSSRGSPRRFYCSRDGENLFSWRSGYSAVANDNCIYLQNWSSTLKLHIDEVHVKADVACDFILKYVTGTASGVVVNGVNWNNSSSNTANAICYNGGVSGLSDAGLIMDLDVVSGVREYYKADGSIILGLGGAFAVQTDTTANIHINIVGWFE